MKKLIVLFLVIIFAATGCKKSPKADFFVLGGYTPMNGLPEKLNGTVEKMIEKVYWGIQNGDTLKKGNQITIKEADSLQWGYLYEVTFDHAGNLLSCNYYDENTKYVGGWQFFKKNHRLDSANWKWRGKPGEYQKLKCNKTGRLVGAMGYNANADTLAYSWKESMNKPKDRIEYQILNNKGILTNRYLYLYNGKGQFLGFEAYNKDGIFDGSNKLVYNEQGKVSDFTFFDKDKKATDIVHRTYEYDAKDNWVRMVSKNNHGEIAIYERTYTYFR
jgi:hypothetical protein